MSSSAEVAKNPLSFIGFPNQKIGETLANQMLFDRILSLAHQAGFSPRNPCEWQKGGYLIYELATLFLSFKPNQSSVEQFHADLLLSGIRDGRLRTKDQLHAAFQFLAQLAPGEPVDVPSYEFVCGIGIVVEESEVISYFDRLFIERRDMIVANRYQSMPSIRQSVRDDSRMKWADGRLVQDQLDAHLMGLLGPKDERDRPQKKKKDDKKQAPAMATSMPGDSVSWRLPPPSQDPFFHQGELGHLHKPGENPQLNGEIMKQHLKNTGGCVLTRFPPEPNGYLHIGHAKAININFGYAIAHGGKCYLRYDDTNPEAEEEQFFRTILDSVEWLGFRPWKITYSSDHFQRLYDLAVDLIRRDKAYVCHCTGEQIHEQRGGDQKGPRFECPHHNRVIPESLLEFDRMKSGYYKEGEAVLRMKMDMTSGNPQFWDLVAYRVLDTPHFRTGKEWRIYPTYDYTHCLCDSFENITHSLCTTEFRNSRESYYWLLDALGVYKPVQWEYGRLNITNTVLSKRKLTKLVQGGYVRGWDDPRLYTLVALRRRGVPPQAINHFVHDCGVSTSQSVIDVRRLEHWVRLYLDDSAPRVAAVIQPLPILLVNLPHDHYQELEVPYMPKSKPSLPGISKGHMVPFTNILFIDAQDFKEDAATDPNFFRLCLGGTVNLLHVPHPIYCMDAVRNADGKVVGLMAAYLDPEKSFPASVPSVERLPKPKSYIQWIGLSYGKSRLHSPQCCEIRIYNDLFLHSDPEDKSLVPGGFLSDINPDSLQVYHGYMDCGPVLSDSDDLGLSLNVPVFEIFIVDLVPREDSLILSTTQAVQFQRIGYFSVDSDSTVEPSAMRDVLLPTLNEEKTGAVMKSYKIPLVSGWVMNRTVTLREDSTKKESNVKI